MAINIAPGPVQNPLAALAALLAQNKSDSSSSDLERAVQQAYLGKFMDGVGDTSPVQSWTQGAARMGNAGLAGLMARRMIDSDKANNSEISNAIGGALGGGGGSPAPAPGPAPMPTAPISSVPNGPMTTGDASPPGANMLASLIGGGGGDVKPTPISQPPMDMAGPSPIPPGSVPMPQPAPQQAGGQAPIGPGQQALIQAMMSKQGAADQPAQLTGGNPGQGIDRSQFAQATKDPLMIKRLADMVNGETGFKDPKLAQIQTESAFNRAQARGIPLDQALLSVGDDRKRGYYASDTYNRPANAQQLAQFQNQILPQVMQGSDVGTQTMGFPVTGNASQMGFAGRRAEQGMYDASKWYSGQPGRGEMFVTEKGDAARFAKNAKSNFPPELLSPQSDAINAQSFAPVQVASNDGNIGIPQQQQPPGVGSFTPGSLPDVPNAAVRPTGPGAPTQMAQQAQQPQMPQQAQPTQPSQAADAQKQRAFHAAQQLLAVGTKDAREYALKLVAPYMQPQQYGFQMTPDGTLIRTDPKGGTAEPVYQSSKPSFVPNASHDQYGNPLGGFVDPTKQTVKLIGPNGQPIDPNSPQGGAGQQSNLHGEEFLKTIDPGKAETVKGIAEGRIPYPAGFIMKTPYGQWLTQAVGQYEPGIDATQIGKRFTFNRQMGSGNPTSIGGQKTLMGTSLGHLGEIADAATSLGNGAGPLPSGMPGSSYFAHGTNFIANTSTSQAAKVNALNDAVQKFSGEVGKLYSGSAGGGIAEREATRERFSDRLSPQEMASSLEMSKALIQSKLSALEGQQDEIFGPGNKARVDFLGESGRAAITKIDAAIAKLRGGQSGSPPQNGAPAQSDVEAEMRRRGLLK